MSNLDDAYVISLFIQIMFSYYLTLLDFHLVRDPAERAFFGERERERERESFSDKNREI